MTPRLQAVVFLVMVNALWGLSFPTAKALNAQLDNHFTRSVAIDSASFRLAAATWIIGLRFGLAFLLIIALFRSLTRTATSAEWKAGAWIGLFFVTGLILQTIGLATIPASRSGFLTSLSVVFTPLIIASLRGRWPSRWLLAGAATAAFGVAVFTGLLDFSRGGIHFAEDAFRAWTLGDTLTTTAAIFFSGQIILIDHFGRRLNPAAFTPGMFLTVTFIAFATFFVLFLFRFDTTFVVDVVSLTSLPRFWLMIGMLSIFPSLLAFSWMNTYQPKVTAIQAAVIYTLEPVFVAAWAMFLPGVLQGLVPVRLTNESLTVPMLVGGTIILLANVLSLWPEGPEGGA